MKKVFVAAAAILCLGAHAEFKDGNKLYAQMTEGYASNGWFNSIGYITGVVDSLYGIAVCPPTTATAAQIFDVVKKYMEDYPQFRHHTADRIVGRAVERVWPCPKKGGGQSL